MELETVKTFDIFVVILTGVSLLLFAVLGANIIVSWYEFKRQKRTQARRLAMAESGEVVHINVTTSPDTRLGQILRPIFNALHGA